MTNSCRTKDASIELWCFYCLADIANCFSQVSIEKEELLEEDQSQSPSSLSKESMNQMWIRIWKITVNRFALAFPIPLVADSIFRFLCSILGTIYEACLICR